MATKVTTGLITDNAITDAKLSATITATTQSASDNSTSVATTAYVTTAIANLADSAPSTLNTLNELAAALGDDANFSTTVTNSIAGKLPLAGGTMTGNLAINNGAGATLFMDDTNGRTLRFRTANSGSQSANISSYAGLYLGGSDNASHVLIDGSGNVGIGNTTPQAKLHVTDGATILDMTDNGYGGLKITDDSSSDYNVNFITGRNQGNTRFNFYRSGRAQGTTPWSDTTPTKIAHFSTNSNYFVGSVGIGTDSPSTNLHVQGSNSAILRVDAQDGGDAPAMTSRIQLYGYEGRGAGIKIRDSVNSASSPNSREWFVGSGYAYGGFNIGFANNGSQSEYSAQAKFAIDTSGNVGIGTVSPSSHLTLHGNMRFNTTNADGNEQRALFNVGGSADPFSITGYKADATTVGMVLNSGGVSYLNGGNVGIGTTSPGGLLTISGTGDAIRIESTNSGEGGAQMDMLHFSSSPADNDVHGVINFGGYYSGSSSAYGSSIKSIWTDVSAKEAKMEFFTRDDSDFSNKMSITKDYAIPKMNFHYAEASSTYANVSTTGDESSNGSGVLMLKQQISVTAGSKILVWWHSGQILNSQGSNSNPQICVYVSTNATAPSNRTIDHAINSDAQHQWYPASSQPSARIFLSGMGATGTLSTGGTYYIYVYGGSYNSGSFTFNYQDSSTNKRGSNIIWAEVMA